MRKFISWSARTLAVLGIAALAVWAANTPLRNVAMVNSTIASSAITGSTGAFTALSDSALTASALAVCTDGSQNLTTSACAYENGGRLTGGSCSTPAIAFTPCTSTVSFFRTEADTNYAISCNGVGLTGWPYIMGVTSKGTTSATVQIGNGSSSAAVASSFSEIDCTLTR